MKKLLLIVALLGASLLVIGCTDNIGNTTNIEQPAEGVDTNTTTAKEIVSKFEIVGCAELTGAGGEIITVKARVLSDTLTSKSSVYAESKQFHTETTVVENTADGDGVDIESEMVSVPNTTGKTLRVPVHIKALLSNGVTKLGTKICVQPPLIQEGPNTDDTSDDNSTTSDDGNTSN